MNTLAARYNQTSHYPIPHADFLRLQHAHCVGVTVLDMMERLNTLDVRKTPDEQGLASVVALLTDQLGKVVNTCESLMFADTGSAAYGNL